MTKNIKERYIRRLQGALNSYLQVILSSLSIPSLTDKFLSFLYIQTVYMFVLNIYTQQTHGSFQFPATMPEESLDFCCTVTRRALNPTKSSILNRLFFRKNNIILIQQRCSYIRALQFIHTNNPVHSQYSTSGPNSKRTRRRAVINKIK